ncbi:Uma2 family endonuclease, partial [Limnofasciculus baicalensis]|nr:Uma2 family endonuclease [Limnofasciculus baicalensis BBK-W-15]
MTALTTKRFTIEEYHRLGELGFFTPEKRVELIRGEIIEMPTKKTPHSFCNTNLVRELIILLGKRAIVRGQEPIILPPDSEPQPDVAIVRNRDDNYLSSHPMSDDIFLIIEISDSTLKFDRKTKLSLYAQANILHYWIFNLIDNHLEIYSQPYQDTQKKSNYRLKQIALPNETIP